MSVFADNDKVADLRIAIDDAENPGFAADAAVAPNTSMRPVHLSHVRDPRVTVVVEICLAL